MSFFFSSKMSVEVVLECAPAWTQVAAAAAPAALYSFSPSLHTYMKRRSYKPCHVFPYSFICPTHEAVKSAAREQGRRQWRWRLKKKKDLI